MAEPLKNSFGPDIPARLAKMVVSVHGAFPVDAFVADSLDGYEDLELTARARHIAAALAVHLPTDRAESLRIIVDSLGSEIEDSDLTGMDSFLYLPFVMFVAEEGLEHFEAAMHAQYELTKRFTSEFSIRAYLERYPDETLARLHEWAADDSVHVRRLVSEGTRPRLPWAPRLRSFQENPQPVVELLELLKDDPEEYVRRSVANNLNDISKDHPEIAVQVARRWWDGGGAERRRMVRHGLRTLIKKGDLGALDVMGYGPSSPAAVEAVRIAPTVVEIGSKVRIEVDLVNPSDQEAGALTDLIVHFVKANGSTSPKVFKGAERTLAAGESLTFRKTISLKQHSTRTHYQGEHLVEIQLNGRVLPGASFVLGS